MKSRINIVIEPDLEREAKRYAKKTRKSFSAIVGEALQRHIREVHREDGGGLASMEQYDGPVSGEGFLAWRKNRTAIRVAKSRRNA